MGDIDNVVFLDLSEQLKGTCYNYIKTFPYSIRINSDDAIELSALEFEACYEMLKNNNESLNIHSHDFQEKVYERLMKLQIIRLFNNEKNNIRLIKKNDENIKGIRHFPRVIVWNITNKCNLLCRHCIMNYLGNNYELKLGKKQIREIVEEMDKEGLERLQISGGEPLCSPYFKDLIISVKKTNICVDIFTNATDIDDKMHAIFADFIEEKPGYLNFHISIDGNEKEHNYLRQDGEAFQKTVANIRRIIGYGGKVYIETIIHDKNYENLEELIEVLISLRIQYVYMHPSFHLGYSEEITDIELTEKQRLFVFLEMIKLKKKYEGMINVNYSDPMFPIIAYYMRNILKISVIQMNKNCMDKALNCVAGIDKLFINCKGDVYPCLLYDNSERDYCGNITSSSLRDLWKSKGMDFVRKPLYESRIQCSKCAYVNYCRGKIKNCRRAIEMISNDYLGVMPACKEIFE